MRFSVSYFAALVGGASSSIIWDGRFNTFASSADLNIWSWSKQVGPYQYYIHGSSAVTPYVNLSPAFKTAADSGSTQGAKFTLDSTAYWNGQPMRRTELVPQTTAPIATGKVWYHFSMMRAATNAPSTYREHQINFFESQFTEMKSGWISGAAGTSNPALQWFVGGTSKWSTTWDAGVWHNVAYEIRQNGSVLAFDWRRPVGSHRRSRQRLDGEQRGRLAPWGPRASRLGPGRDANEDFYFSGVYIESGSLTTSVAGPGGGGGVVVGSSSSASPGSSSSSSSSGGGGSSTSARSTSSSTSAASSVVATTARPTTLSTTSSAGVTTSSAPAAGGGTIPKYAQCAGLTWKGSGTCVAGTICKYSSDYYSQCL